MLFLFDRMAVESIMSETSSSKSASSRLCGKVKDGTVKFRGENIRASKIETLNASEVLSVVGLGNKTR